MTKAVVLEASISGIQGTRWSGGRLNYNARLLSHSAPVKASQSLEERQIALHGEYSKSVFEDPWIGHLYRQFLRLSSSHPP